MAVTEFCGRPSSESHEEWMYWVGALRGSSAQDAGTQKAAATMAAATGLQMLAGVMGKS